MQQIYITPGAVVAFLIVVLLILGSYWLMRSRGRQGPLRGIARQPVPSRGVSGQRGDGARELEARLNQLLKANAGWNEIALAVNPAGAASVAADLQAIRGPHMFAPALAIQVLQEGCKQAMSRSSSASAAEAVLHARRSMERVTRFGD